jgi:transcriptional regulator with XRE-family HTH domain
MSENLAQIALRIKELREICDFTTEDLAKELGITVDDYCKYESGEMDIPVSLLYEIANKFEIDVATLLTGNEPKLHMYSLVRNGEGLPIERRKEYNYYDIGYKMTNKKAEPFLVEVPAMDDVQHLFSHPGQEFMYVVEGVVQVTIGQQVLVLGIGDALFFDSKYQHGMKALNGQAAKFVDVLL